MSQHITDHPRDRHEGERARNFSKIEREQGETPHKASAALMRRTAELPTLDQRLEKFTRVERGHIA